VIELAAESQGRSQEFRLMAVEAFPFTLTVEKKNSVKGNFVLIVEVRSRW